MKSGYDAGSAGPDPLLKGNKTVFLRFGSLFAFGRKLLGTTAVCDLDG